MMARAKRQTDRSTPQTAPSPVPTGAAIAERASTKLLLRRLSAPPLRLNARCASRVVVGTAVGPAVEVALWRREAGRGWAVSVRWRGRDGEERADAWLAPGIEAAATALEAYALPTGATDAGPPALRLAAVVAERRLAQSLAEAVGEALYAWFQLEESGSPAVPSAAEG